MGLKESGLRGSLRNVSTGVGIPDSVDNQWPANEGEGSVLSNNILSVDINLNGGGWSWDNDVKWDEDIAPISDGSTGTFFESESEISGLNSEKGGLIFWVDVESFASNAPLYSTDVASEGTPENGTSIRLDGDDLKLLQQPGGEENTFDAIKVGERVLYAVGWDGDNIEIWGYDTSNDSSTAQFLDETVTDERGVSNDEHLSGFSRTDVDREVEGGIEQIATFDDTPDTNDVEAFWEQTK